jgi:hypothetical protein
MDKQAQNLNSGLQNSNATTKEEKDFQDRLQNNVTKLEQDGQKVQVLGQIVNGQLVIDQDSLDELKAKYPNAKMAFVALNSPFDPASLTD